MGVGKPIADSHPKLFKVKQGRFIQKQIALKLYERANALHVPSGLCEISKFQRSLPGYQIIGYHDYLVIMHAMHVFMRGLGVIKRLFCTKTATIIMQLISKNETSFKCQSCSDISETIERKR